MSETYSCGRVPQMLSMRRNEPAMLVSPTSPTINQQDDKHASLVALLQRRLRNLSSQQEELVKNREQLLVNRESVSMDRKAIAEQRTCTANTEIAFITALRKHFCNLERPLPNDLLLAYDEVEKHHLRLRILEEEYLHAEENLGASEWTFNDQESDLYQYNLESLLLEESDEDGGEHIPTQLVSTGTPVGTLAPTHAVQYQKVLTDHSQLVESFDTLQKQQTLRLETFTQPETSRTRLEKIAQMDDGASQLADDLLDMITKCEVELQQLRPYLDISAGIKFGTKRQASEPVYDRKSSYEHIEFISYARSAGSVQPLETRLDAGHGNITRWSLESLKSSALEKLQYLNFLHPKIKKTDAMEQGFGHWEPLITRIWAEEDGGWEIPSD
jgi:hypothetical protein